MSAFPEIFKPEDFTLSEPPPPFLYKYMVADRIGDVLEGGMVRFTHLIDTNDSFEVRKTFKRFAGPKFIQMMKKGARATLTSDYLEKNIQKKLAKAGRKIPTSVIREMVIQKFGMPLEEYIQSQADTMIEMFSGSIDSYKSSEDFLLEIGSTLLCFSLSERYDTAAMWAHYGGNHTGLVIKFDTSHTWFRKDSNSSHSRLQKIKYLDDLNDELLDDLQAAFSSKATDWAYEREWRMNCAMEQIEKTIEIEAEKIHLRSFPPEAVASIIVGAKASEHTINRVREVLGKRYRHVTLQQATPQRMSASYMLQDI